MEKEHRGLEKGGVLGLEREMRARKRSIEGLERVEYRGWKGSRGLGKGGVES